MSSSNCCFLTCFQISHEAGQVVWYSPHFKNFPVYCDPCSQGCSVVNEAEVHFFSWNSLAFSTMQRMLAIWSLAPLPFLSPTYALGSSRFMYCWSLAWRLLCITLPVYEMSIIVWFEYSLALSSFGTGMKTDLFQSCGPCWVFQMCWYIEWSTLILCSSTGILSPPLALLVVMLPKAHLTSHSRIEVSPFKVTVFLQKRKTES